MRIEHVAIWTRDLERLRAFYERYLGGRAGAKYINPRTRFESYFLQFSSGTRLELMRKPGLEPQQGGSGERSGYAHLAFAVGSEEAVDALTDRLRADGYRIAGEPRRTGDGYYESVVLDPDGNRVEITV
jgi:lactoylglutathione lyase